MFMTRLTTTTATRDLQLSSMSKTGQNIYFNIFNVHEYMPLTPKKKPPIIGQAKELMIGEIVIRIEVIVPKDASFFSGLT